MKKSFRALALLLCAVLAAAFFAGCNLVEVDDSPDLDQVVATVNGKDITLGEYQNLHDYYVQIYAMYGMDITTDPENYNAFKLNLLDSLINQETLRQKAEELGFTNLSAEDAAEVDEVFQADYAEFMESFREQAESDNKNDSTINVEARMDELARAQLAENGQDYDETKRQYVLDKAMDNLERSIYDSVTVDDAAVQSFYDEELAAQKEAIEADPLAYEEYANGEADAPALFAPEGYRYATHILVKFEGIDATIDTRLTEIKTRTAEIDARLTAIETETTALDTAAADYQTKLSALNGEKDTLTAEKGTLTTETETLTAQRKAATLEKANGIIAQLDSGKAWDVLAAQYNEDDGTKSASDDKEAGPYFETGYLVGPKTTSYYQAFTDEALALTEIGQYSKVPAETAYGYHILMLKSLVTPGVVPFETVKAELHDVLLGEKQQEKWFETQDQWVKEATVVKYESRAGITPAAKPTETAE